MKKRLLGLVLALSFFITSTSALAAETNGDTQQSDNDYYQITGQIDIAGLDVSVNDETGDIDIAQKDDKASVTSEKLELKRQLENNAELKNLLKTIISKKDGTLNAIGYTTVYTKVVTDASGKHLEPITKAEASEAKKENSISSFTAGTPTPYYSLTLYTAANLTIRNSVKYVDAYSVAHWSAGVGVPISSPAMGSDFITLTIPSEYMLTSSYLTGGYNSYKNSEGYSSVIYGFDEWISDYYAADITLFAGGQSTKTATSSKKFISKYVHTYGYAMPSFTIGSTDIGIALGTSSWQIASSVIITS